VSFFSLREQVDLTTPMGKAVFTIIAAVSELERDIIKERVQAGVDRARAAGKHCGRPRREMDLWPAVAMLRTGFGLKAISKSLGVSRATLRRRLEESGAWPTSAPSEV
jgi:DNA invertase Pin-like site-specific DNA recombinase